MLSSPTMITVTILTKNCEKTLRKTLLSVSSFDEILILDTGSTDGTLDLAKSFPRTVIHTSPFLGFGPLHNLATSLAKNDWILSIDSDEVLSPELVEEIHALYKDPNKVYCLPRLNYFRDKHIKWCGGWYPDLVHRLYHRNYTCFTGAAVHEQLITEGMEKIPLSNALHHVPYREIGDFLSKMQSYTTLFAAQNKGKKRGSLFKALVHSWYAFFKSYVLKKGFLGGKEGFIISAYNGHTAFYKYLKLEEINRN